MKPKIKINEIISILDKIYPDAKCALNYSKDYELLIATILSAQATDKSVNKVTGILFEKYPTLTKLKNLSEKELEVYFKPLGMSKIKAHYIYETLKLLKDKVPNDADYLLKMPGVGAKVKNVVLAELYNEPLFAVDTHVNRLMKRFGLVEEDSNVNEIEQKLYELVPSNKRIKFNHQLITFGRNICKAKNPLCAGCPFYNKCGGIKK